MQCPNCHYEPTLSEMQQSPNDCVKCGVNYEEHARRVAQAQYLAVGLRRPTPVVVVDFDMSFWAMVRFMVKWAIASIPALIVLLLIFTGIPAFFSALAKLL